MKLKLLLLSCLFWMAGTAQNLVSISPFAMPSNVPANTADWGSLNALFVLATANGTPLPIALESAQVSFTIKKGGSKVCGGTLQAAQFTARTKYFKATDISGMLGGCILRPGTYQLCVQFFANLNGSTSALTPVSAEKCSSNEFVIENPTGGGLQTDTKYTPPANISPTDKKEFTDKEIKAPITFRWTPCLPKPQDPPIYRLKVWQLMQGQNGTTAMRSNTPVVEKDVRDINQIMVNNMPWEMGANPIAFVWSVEVVDELGKLLGRSEPTGFNLLQSYQPPVNISPKQNQIISLIEFEKDKAITFRWVPLCCRPSEPPPMYRLKVWQLMQGQNGQQAMRSNQPIITKDVENVSEISLESNIFCHPPQRPCPGQVIWLVEVTDKQGTVLAISDATLFSFENKNTQPYQPPVNQSPKQNQIITLIELEKDKAITFRWIPCLPKPQDPPIYRLKVWQLMQGQTGAQAMRSNNPVVTKDVAEATQFTKPNLMGDVEMIKGATDLVWNVEALSKEGKTLGTSEASGFRLGGSLPSTASSSDTCCLGFGAMLWGTASSPPPSTVFTASSGTIGSLVSGSSLYLNVTYNCNPLCITSTPSLTYVFTDSYNTVLSSTSGVSGVTTPITVPTMPSGGSCTLTIFGQCGTAPCDSASYQIPIISCCPGSSWGIQKFDLSPLTVPAQTMPSIGSTLTAGIGSSMIFNFTYNCNPLCTSPPATIIYVLSGGGTVTTSSSLTSLPLAMPTTTGTYLLTIYAKCGTDTCSKLKYKINVVDCCTGSSWCYKDIKRTGPPPPITSWLNLSCGNAWVGPTPILSIIKRNTPTKFRVGYKCGVGAVGVNCSSVIKYEILTSTLGPIAGVPPTYSSGSCYAPPTVSSIITIPPSVSTFPPFYYIRITAYCNGTLCATCINKFRLVP